MSSKSMKEKSSGFGMLWEMESDARRTGDVPAAAEDDAIVTVASGDAIGRSQPEANLPTERGTKEEEEIQEEEERSERLD